MKLKDTLLTQILSLKMSSGLPVFFYTQYFNNTGFLILLAFHKKFLVHFNQNNATQQLFNLFTKFNIFGTFSVSFIDNQIII